MFIKFAVTIFISVGNKSFYEVTKFVDYGNNTKSIYHYKFFIFFSFFIMLLRVQKLLLKVKKKKNGVREFVILRN